jgi:hypothetical protein
MVDKKPAPDGTGAGFYYAAEVALESAGSGRSKRLNSHSLRRFSG